MNWLAHVFLSDPDVEARLGNLLADIVKGPDRVAMPARFLAGVQQHQAIDAFTDSHGAVRRSRARLTGDYSHARGILVDVFYDHLLALEWETYAAEPLRTFADRFYAEVQAHPITLPPNAQIAVERMIEHDALGSYRWLEGVEGALGRISVRLRARTGREFRLERGVPELVENLDGFREDFAEFFPALRAHLGRGTRA